MVEEEEGEEGEGGEEFWNASLKDVEGVFEELEENRWTVKYRMSMKEIIIRRRTIRIKTKVVFKLFASIFSLSSSFFIDRPIFLFISQFFILSSILLSFTLHPSSFIPTPLLHHLLHHLLIILSRLKDMMSLSIGGKGISIFRCSRLSDFFVWNERWMMLGWNDL